MDLSTLKQVINSLMQKTTANGCTEEEAASAAAKAQELLSKNRIELADLAVEEEPIEIERDCIDEAAGKYRFPSWRSILAKVVAEVNGCMPVRYRNPSRVVVYGTRGNIERSQYLYVILKRQVEEFSRKNASWAGRTAANNYRMGMVHTLHRRLREAERSARVNAPSNALVRINREMELAEKAAGKLKKGSAPSYWGNQSMYSLGAEHGHRVQMNRGLAGGTAARRLLGGK